MEDKLAGSAPKVEEAADDIFDLVAERFDSGGKLKLSEIEEALRPCSPPASQTPKIDLNDVREDIGDAIQALRSGWPADDVINILKECSESINLPATPASTARTDGWVSVEDRLPVEGQMVLVAYDCNVPEKQISIGFSNGGKWGEAFGLVRVTHWQPLPAAPGSVPQARDHTNSEVHANTTATPSESTPNSETNSGVPRAEPPKEDMK